MKTKSKFFLTLMAMVLTAGITTGIVYAAWNGTKSIPNSLKTATVSLTELTSSAAFTSEDKALVPYDQTGALLDENTNILTKGFEVKLGDDAEENGYSLGITDFTQSKAVSLYYMVTAVAAGGAVPTVSAPADAAALAESWTALSNNTVIVAAVANGYTYYVSIVLDSSSTADAGADITFTVGLQAK